MTWHRSLDELPPGPQIIVANEFFDALPVHQSIKVGGGWHERVIKIDKSGSLTFGTASEQVPQFERLLPAGLRNAPDGACYEWRPVESALELGRRLVRDGGAALIIDYGHSESGLGETLQAVGGHAYADPLGTPGLVDLTAHVDFEVMAHAVESMGAIAHGPLSQREFLTRLGIASRAATLKAGATPEVAAGIDGALARLTGPGRDEMGELFKVIAFADRSLGALPGFAR